jgi:hypothetical protein
MTLFSRVMKKMSLINTFVVVAENRELALWQLVNMLVPEKQAWSIKNYRYV